MYLVLPTEAAFKRNKIEAIQRGYTYPTIMHWVEIPISDTHTALHVGDGDGLTEEEKAQLVETIQTEYFREKMPM